MKSLFAAFIGIVVTLLCWYGLCELNPLGVTTHQGGPNPLVLAGYWKVMLASLAITSAIVALIIVLLISRKITYFYFAAGALLGLLLALIVTAITANGELAII